MILQCIDLRMNTDLQAVSRSTTSHFTCTLHTALNAKHPLPICWESTTSGWNTCELLEKLVMWHMHWPTHIYVHITSLRYTKICKRHHVPTTGFMVFPIPLSYKKPIEMGEKGALIPWATWRPPLGSKSPMSLTNAMPTSFALWPAHCVSAEEQSLQVLDWLRGEGALLGNKLEPKFRRGRVLFFCFNSMFCECCISNTPPNIQKTWSHNFGSALHFSTA